GQAYSLSRSANSDYDLLAAWMDLNNGIQYKYTCNGDLITPFIAGNFVSPLIGKSEATIHEASLQVYPNPAQNYMYITLDETIEAYTLSIYNIYGRLIIEQNI